MIRVLKFYKSIFLGNNRNLILLFAVIVASGLLMSICVYILSIHQHSWAVFLLSFFSIFISVSVVFYFLNKWNKINRLKSKLSLSEDLLRFKSIATASNQAIWDNNLLTGETYYNPIMFSLFGYKKEDTSDNENWWQSNIHPEDIERVLKGMDIKLKSSENTWNDEYRFRHKDGSYKFVHDRCYILRGSNQKPERLIGSMMDVTNEKEKTKKQIDQLLEKKNISGRNIMEFFEQRQKEIRDVLHEDIAQELAALKFKLAAQSADQKNEHGTLNENIEQLGASISKIRDISGKISPANAPGLNSSSMFADLINSFQTESGLKVELVMKEDFNDFENDKESFLYLFYRITQIQLENIVKHAGNCEVLVELYKEENKKTLIISDTGLGCVKEHLVEGKGFKEIKSRIEMFNGIVNILTAPGNGFTLEVIIQDNSGNNSFY